MVSEKFLDDIMQEVYSKSPKKCVKDALQEFKRLCKKECKKKKNNPPSRQYKEEYIKKIKALKIDAKNI